MFYKYSKPLGWLIRLGGLVEFESKNLLIHGKKASISGASGTIKRQASTTSRLPEKLRANYEKFQRDDGVPVYLKNGLPDRILIGLTLILIAIGMADGCVTLLKLYNKK